MRRFELSEGTSNKFWQIEVDDTSFTVTFGRIGTNGQTQTKTFESAKKAEAEADKLVKEKTKKGYVEVNASGIAPAAPVAPKPVPAKPAAPSAPSSAPAAAPAAAHAPARTVLAGISWTDEAKRAVAPRKGWDVVTPRASDARGPYTRIAAAFKKAAAAIDNGIVDKSADGVRTSAARAAFSGTAPEASLDEIAQADAFALVGPPLVYGDDSRRHDFVGYWAAVAGLPFTLRALARAATVRTVSISATTHAKTNVLAIQTSGKEDVNAWWRDRNDDETWRMLRHEVLASDDRAKLEALAGDIRADAALSVRALLASAFEREDWAATDLDEIAKLASNDPMRDSGWPLVLLLSNIDDVMPTATRVFGNPWTIAQGIDSIRYDLVARFGASAAGPLITLLSEAQTSGVDRMRSLGEALALIVSDEVAQYFAKNLQSKELRAIATEYLQANPHVSVPFLVAAALNKGTLADASRAVLKPLVAIRHPAVAAVRAACGPAGVALLDALEADTALKEEAAAADLPAVLREPPWTRKTKLAAPKVVKDLPTLPFEEQVVWKKGERDAKLAATKNLYRTNFSAQDTLAFIAKTNVEPMVEPSYQRHRGTIFTVLEGDVAVAAFNEANHAKFNWDWQDVAEAMLARHDIAVLPGMLAVTALNVTATIGSLTRVSSPRVAWIMADVFARLKKFRADAMNWLATFPEAAAIGLVPIAVGTPGKVRDTAEIALRFLATRGYEGIVRGVAERYGSAALEAVDIILKHDPLLALPKKLPTLPAFFSAGAFARPLLANGRALPLEAVNALGTMLAFTSFDDPYAGIADVKAACEPRSLAAFAWDLFEAWLMSGASSKEQWAMQALGLLGNDDSARKLTPLIRAWPGEAAHARAVAGLDVLARIATDIALMHLHGIAQKVKFKGLQEKAREKIDHIAEARGLTAEELADRLVPDLGLDDHGTLILDFGPRRFKVVFDEQLKPAVLDEDGQKRSADLPKPGKSDDAEKAKAAVETWKALKKDAKTIAQGQILRLELAMCAQRRWSCDVFEQFLLGHPLLVHLVRRLVWGVYSDENEVVGTFRVAEDSSLANVDDESYTLPDGARIGIVHRLEIDDALARKWAQPFSDYEILQPFEQLGRATVSPTDAEAKATELGRVAGTKVPTGKVLGLDARGWRRGAPQDAGVTCWYEKPLANDRTAFLDLNPGIFTGMISESPEQELGKVTVSTEATYWSKTNMQPFGALGAIEFSELMRDLDALRT